MSEHGSKASEPAASQRSSSTNYYGEVVEARYLADTFPQLALTTPAASVRSIAPSRRSAAPSAISAPSTASRTPSSAPPAQYPDLPTLDDVRTRALIGICVRAINTAETVDGTRVGVVQTIFPASDVDFLLSVAIALKHRLLTTSYIFAVLPAAARPGAACPLVVCASAQTFVDHAATLLGAKFIGRMLERQPMHADSRGAHPRMLCFVRDLGGSTYDDEALLDVIRKAARAPADPLAPPPGSCGIDQLIRRARTRLERVSPQTAYQELRDLSAQWPVLLVDIRSEAQRTREGGIGGSVVVERNMLEWRLDPRSTHRLPVAERYDLRVIVFCSDGTASSLAAASLLDLGLLNATDMIGGYQSWKAAGLPSDVEVLAHGLSIDTLRSFSISSAVH